MLDRHVPTLSIVLLTHATVAHLAAYAHACKHFPLFTRIPIYATTPVISLGRTLLQDLYASTPLASTFISPASLSEGAYSYTRSSEENSNILLQPPTPEEIASYFSLIHPLKYSQPHQPLPSPSSPPLNGLTITAYNAGHTLGGTIWHIQHGLESIVYAVDWNQARENILAGAAWLGGAGAGGAEVIEQLRKPTALICSSHGAERVALAGGRGKRDELLLDMIKSAIIKGGTVLIPTDSSARVLELAYLLEHAWRKDASEGGSTLNKAQLYLASRNIGATMRYTRSMLEWMDDGIIREFESLAGGQRKENGTSNTKPGAGPFDFKHLRLLERRGQIRKILNIGGDADSQAPRVILASDTSLEWGFSRDVLKTLAADSRNLVILTERASRGPSSIDPESNGLARTLWRCWEERKDGVALEPNATGENLEQVYGGGREVVVKETKKLALEGNELTAYQQWLATQRQLQTTLQPGGAIALETSADAVDDASSDSSSDSEDLDTEQQGKALNLATTLGQANRKKIGMSDEDLGINILLRKKGVYDYDVRGKKGREKMFPLVIRRRRVDEFGELIRPDEYLRAEERDEVDGQDMRQPGKFDTQAVLGKKRKWDHIGANGDQKMASGTNKRLNSGNGGDVDDSFSAGATGDLGLDVDSVEDDIEEDIIGPCKVTFSTESFPLNLRLAFVDFGGLHDKRSLQMLIPLIQPRKLILVSGTAHETSILATDCRKLLTTQAGVEEAKTVDVYTPDVGVTIDASVDTNAWTVKLTDELVKRLRWQNVKGLGVVTVTGRLTTSAPPEPVEEESHKKQKMLEGEAEDVALSVVAVAPKPTAKIPSLDVVPTSMASATRSIAQPLHVGDLRLADLRKLMLSSGHTAEFRGEGTLLIDGSVVVRKMGTGRIEVEAVGSGMGRFPESTSFQVVKNKIYEGLAVVAGG